MNRLRRKHMETKERKEDRRTKYTRQAIKDTFLALLEKKTFSKITVTEICKLTEINRGTFYLHYYDMDDVLDDILTEMLKDTKSLEEHLMCPGRAASNCTFPFCHKVHNTPRYQVLFLDDIISSRIIDKIADVYKEGYVTWLMSHSLLTFEQAEAVFYFQMNGCHHGRG